MTTLSWPTFSPQGQRTVRWVLAAGALLGFLVSLTMLWRHITTDPLADVYAYYWAGGRLNAGLPLYPPDQSVATPLGYPYPPLLAILFRPLALLPYDIAAAIWEVVVLAAFLATVWWLGPRRRETWLVLGFLAPPIVWCLIIGQAQVLLTLFTTLGMPWSVAIAANIKLFPTLICLWWIGRRDWRRFGQFVAAMAVLGLIQLILAPQASLDYLTAISLHQVGEVVNISPWVISPVLWAVLFALGVVAVLVLAPSRLGWAAAVSLSVLGNPRLIVYMLMALLAVAGGSPRPGTSPGPGISPSPGTLATRDR